MTTILVDHNIEGQAALLLGTYLEEGWADLSPVRFVTFQEVGLIPKSSDRVVWRFAQAHEMVLLTNNRNMRGQDSLEQTLREENTPTALPVLTIGNIERIVERAYRARCAARLAEVIYELEQSRGVSRLFIP